MAAGRPYYLWASIDMDTGEVLAVHLTTTRAFVETLAFLAKVARWCRNRPLVYVDRGPSHPWVLRRYGFPFAWSTFGPK